MGFIDEDMRTSRVYVDMVRDRKDWRERIRIFDPTCVDEVKDKKRNVYYYLYGNAI